MPEATTPPPPDKYHPWTRGQVRVVDQLPDRGDQAVNVALSPTGGWLALSVGQQLIVYDVVAEGRRAVRRYEFACAPAPGLTWSPAGGKLAFRDGSGHGRIVELPGPNSPESRITSLRAASAMAFTPDGAGLAILASSTPGRMKLTLVTAERAEKWERTLTRNRVTNQMEGVCLAFSPDGRMLACAIGLAKVWVVDAATGETVREYEGHTETVTGLSWIDNETVLSASPDATLQLWHPHSEESAPESVVETIPARGLVYERERGTALIWSRRGTLLAWSLEGTPAQLWDREPPERNVAAHFTRPAVSAAGGLLALVDAGGAELTLVREWKRSVSSPAATTTYANAKVLLLGDSGVGKSGLAMVLAGKEFKATDSTHGRRIWRIPAAPGAEETAEAADEAGDNREVLLWDLAGQPGYRIVHQLHLGGAAVALILFDAKSETTPLAGVQHWARAVRHAHPVTASGTVPPTFLVAARVDRGGINVSDQRIEKLKESFALTEFLTTSAKEGTNTDLLREKLLAAIDWERIPVVASTTLFAAVKKFVASQASSGTLLVPVDELCEMFQRAEPSSLELMTGQEQPAGNEITPNQLISIFEGCIARLEDAGLVKRLKFGGYVLLQPELLDSYAGAIVNAARDEPDGLGSILESTVVELDFAVPLSEPVLEKQKERLLVLATLEELLQSELALRERTENGFELVFPSAYRRDLPSSEAPRGNGVIFRFEGPIQNIYATLIVRLTRSNTFTRVETWQSAARFAAGGGECTVLLSFDGEGRGELTIGYDGMPDPARKQFERFVHTHLQRWAESGTVARERQYSCPFDGTAFTPQQVQQVIARKRQNILCPVCEERIPLLDDYDPDNGTDEATAKMDASADEEREKASAAAVVRGKEEVAEFDVFLCHNWEDKPAVREIARQLQERGLRPWLDENQLRPGGAWQPELERVIARIPAAAVIVGSAVGPWQDQEIDALLRQFVERRCVVVPVLLPGADVKTVPLFLGRFTWVNVSGIGPDPIDQLVWAITGKQPDR